MEKLSETGCVYVTLTAAKEYARHERCGVEAARRQLTVYLLGATRVQGSGEPELWRYRRRSTGLDISARVVMDDGLAVVVSVEVREDSRTS